MNREITTKDGTVSATVKYNPFRGLWQVIIGGTVYSEYKTRAEAINELDKL
jgi:hypothetical protein